MSSNISGKISDFITSYNFAETGNIENGKKSYKSSSDHLNNKISSSSNNNGTFNSVETTFLISAFKNLTSLIKTILKIFITPENFEKYEKNEDYYEEKVSNEIIEDLKVIANENRKLKDKEEGQKNMESIGLNTDINLEYISLSETMKEMKEYQKRNNELLSQIFNFKKTIIDLKKEINFLSNFIKVNINNTLENTLDIISEEASQKNGLESKSKIYNNINQNNSRPYIGLNKELPFLNSPFSIKFINRFRPHKIVLNSPFSLPIKYIFNENEKTLNNNNINNNKSKVKFKVNNPNSRNESKSKNKTISEENNNPIINHSHLKNQN